MRMEADIRLTNLDAVKAARDDVYQKISELDEALGKLQSAVFRMGAVISQPEADNTSDPAIMCQK